MLFKKIYRKMFLSLVLITCALIGLLSNAVQTLEPAKAQIVFNSNRDGNWEIYVMDADGKNPRNLTNHPAADFKPSWSSDGKIAFVSFRERGPQIYIMDLDGRNLKKLTSNIRKVYDRPGWSPDGTKIAFASDQEVGRPVSIFVMDVEGKNIRTLTKSLRGEAWHPSWSPDSQHIAFTYYGDFNQNQKGDIYVMDADGMNFRNLTDNPPKALQQNSFPVWSPDGRRIAWQRDWNIWVMELDGKNPRNLTERIGGGTFPSWLPDGQRIIFTSYRDVNEEIYVMNADETDLQRLTSHPKSDNYPAWFDPAFVIPVSVSPAAGSITTWGWIKQTTLK